MKQIEFIEKEKRNASLVKFWREHEGITYRALGAIYKITGQRAQQIIDRELKRQNKKREDGLFEVNDLKAEKFGSRQ